MNSNQVSYEVSKADRLSTNTARRAAAGAFAGTALEYYDLVIYGTASALVFGDLFFGDVDPQLALIISLGVFASGYLARPLGALLFGYIGDRYGRRTALLITIWMMGGATVLIGVLPTYAVAGAIAPVLLILLRLCQGLALGGELGGAILIAVEHAPSHRRGFFGSFASSGGQAGTIMATGIFALLATMPTEQFLTWGWRVPFLLSAIIVVVGVIIRNKIAETPDFEEVSASKTERKSPLRITATRHWREVLTVILILIGTMGIWNLLTVYSLSYAVGVLGMNKTTFLWFVAVAALVVLVMNPVWGHLSDKFGRRKVLVAGLIAEACLLLLFIAALGTQNEPVILMTLVAIAALGYAAVNGTFPVFIVESIPAEVRYTAGSLGIQIAALIAGFVPVVAALLQGTVLGIWGITLILFAICIPAALCVRALDKSRSSRRQPELQSKY